MSRTRRPTRTGGREAIAGHIPGLYSLAVGMPNTSGPKGWKWTKLSDVARLETGHTPSRKHPEYWDGDIPWIGIRDATQNHGRTLSDTHQHTSELGISNSSARVLPANTVCLSRTASVGYVVVMGRPMATSQDFVNWVCSRELYYQFLKYVLLSERRSFSHFASGTTHQTIYFPEVKAFHICLPPLRVQHRIAAILAAYDELIENNRRRIQILEEMARLIYREWFVNFRFPGHEDVEMENSSLGTAPIGWQKTLGDVLNLKRGYDLPKKRRTPGAVPIVSSSGVSGWHNEHKVRGPGLVTGRYGTLGEVFYSETDFWPLNTTLYVQDFKGNNIHLIQLLLEHLDLARQSAAAAVPGLNRNALHLLPVAFPPQELQVSLADVFATMRDTRLTLEARVGNLCKTRDLLLPRLISGEIDVSELDIEVPEEAA